MATVERQTYTVEQAARILGTSPTTVRRSIKEGRLPGVVLHGEVQDIYVIPVPAFRKFLETGTNNKPGDPAEE